ncbi:MAG: YhcH/YjgK/YiaL family protein [Clostridia bacterium]|nr:YhcH/YjgK/YiaL family protein [Clostridia bacterium]
MIFDKMERLTQYRGLNKNLDRLIDFALNCRFEALVPGKNEVDSENCWVGNNVAELAPERSTYERHLEYIDLQIPIDEGEIIAVKPVEDLSWPEADGETRFTEGEGGTLLNLAPGTFAIFFPGDAHCCGISRNGQTSVRKLVGKARV